MVIVGSDPTGLQTARLLNDWGHDIVIIELNPDRVQDLADERVATVIKGDATNSEILRQADQPATGENTLSGAIDPFGCLSKTVSVDDE